MGNQVWVHPIDSATLASHRVEAHPSPDEEWLRIYRSNAEVLAGPGWRARRLLARLVRRPAPEPPPFHMDPPPARPTDDGGVSFAEWAAERIAAGHADDVSDYLRDCPPGVDETSTYEKHWGLVDEFDDLSPSYLRPELCKRFSALCIEEATRTIC